MSDLRVKRHDHGLTIADGPDHPLLPRGLRIEVYEGQNGSLGIEVYDWYGRKVDVLQAGGPGMEYAQRPHPEYWFTPIPKEDNHGSQAGRQEPPAEGESDERMDR